jgi:hypothetical protein
MITLALTVMLAEFQQEPGAVVPVSWARCQDGGYADFRPDIPLLVLSSNEQEGEWRPPFATGFVLYADGRLIARKGMSLFEWRLTDRQRDALWKRVGGDELLALDDDHHVVNARKRDVFGGMFGHLRTPQTELHLWKDGCRKTIVIRGLSEVVLSWKVEGVRSRSLEDDREQARTALKSLPPTVARAIRQMMTARPASTGKRWCDLPACYSRERVLAHQDLWLETGGRFAAERPRVPRRRP